MSEKLTSREAERMLGATVTVAVLEVMRGHAQMTEAGRGRVSRAELPWLLAGNRRLRLALENLFREHPVFGLYDLTGEWENEKEACQ